MKRLLNEWRQFLKEDWPTVAEPKTLEPRVHKKKYGWGSDLKRRYRWCSGSVESLKAGCKGKAVRKFQEVLQAALDYDYDIKKQGRQTYVEKPNVRNDEGKFDGYFGPATMTAVQAFARNNNIKFESGAAEKNAEVGKAGNEKVTLVQLISDAATYKRNYKLDDPFARLWLVGFDDTIEGGMDAILRSKPEYKRAATDACMRDKGSLACRRWREFVVKDPKKRRQHGMPEPEMPAGPKGPPEKE